MKIVLALAVVFCFGSAEIKHTKIGHGEPMEVHHHRSKRRRPLHH